MDQPRDLVSSKSVLEFLTVANEYCLLMEQAHQMQKETLLEYMQRILPLLFLKGSLLPDHVPSNPELNERFVTEEDWEHLFNSLRITLGSGSQYWYIEHPSENVPEPQRGTIAEDLADIYQEMKDFVLLYQKPLTASKENAIASCKSYFIGDWGRKTLRVAVILHDRLYPCCEGH